MKLGELDVSGLVAWAGAIPLEEWPKVAGNMRTAEWFGAGAAVKPYEAEIMEWFPGGTSSLHYFSMVLPGHRIAAHRDEQMPEWICRVHVPLITNPLAEIIIEGVAYHLQVGSVYRINTRLEHSVENRGATPRLHWMFDVHAPAARL